MQNSSDQHAMWRFLKRYGKAIGIIAGALIAVVYYFAF